MSDDQNYAQQVKRASTKSETRFGFPSPEELGKERIEAREVMRKSTTFRWAKFITAQQVFRRSAEAEVRAGHATSAAQTFWYQNDNHTTTLVYLVYYTLSDKTRTQSDLQLDLAFSAPFVRKLYRTALERGLITKTLQLTNDSLELYFRRVKEVLALPELQDFADSLALLNLVSSKAPNIED